MFEELKSIVEQTLDEVLPKAQVRPSVLSEAMRYAVGSGGKRVRPLICLASAIAAGGKSEDAKFAAAAIEILHNYTLVHDDLPAMDNDVERRGNPTVWKKYGEANAILVGDALQALAYAVAAKSPVNPGRIIAELGVAGLGVVQGQVEDIAATKDVGFIYTHKTADLFVAAAVMGALAANASGADTERLRSFALNLGLASQYEDDLLDCDSPYGRDKTAQLAAECTSAAIAALEGLPGDTSFLRTLASRLLGREV